MYVDFSKIEMKRKMWMMMNKVLRRGDKK